MVRNKTTARDARLWALRLEDGSRFRESGIGEILEQGMETEDGIGRSSDAREYTFDPEGDLYWFGRYIGGWNQASPIHEGQFEEMILDCRGMG